MKKTYLTPRAAYINLDFEGVVCGSVDGKDVIIGGDKGDYGEEAATRNQGSSNLWDNWAD